MAAIAGDQLLAEMKENGERAKGGGDLRKELQPATLSGLGVTTTQSSRWQKIGALDDGTSKAVSHCKKKHAISSVEATTAERTTERRTSRSKLLREMAECGERQ